MPELSRALRNLSEDILHAHQQLNMWRRNGDATKIQFWVRRRDQLLERWSEVSQLESKGAATAIRGENTVR